MQLGINALLEAMSRVRRREYSSLTLPNKLPSCSGNLGQIYGLWFWKQDCDQKNTCLKKILQVHEDVKALNLIVGDGNLTVPA